MKTPCLFLTAILLFAFCSPALFCQEEVSEEETLAQEENELVGEDEVVQEGELLQEEKDPEAAYASFVDSLKRIRMLQTDEDYFSASQLASKGRRLVNYANGKFQRRFYDDDFRLEKIEYWKQGSTSAQSSMERLVVFNPPNAAKIHSVFETNFSEKYEKRSFYFSDGRLKSERKNYFDDDGNLLRFEAVSFRYDSSLRKTQERLQKYKVEKKSVRLESDEIRNSKYNGKNLEETSYYKNSVLRVRTVYQDQEKGDYVKTTYFDGGIIVRDFYRDNLKVGSSIFNGGENEG